MLRDVFLRVRRDSRLYELGHIVHDPKVLRPTHEWFICLNTRRLQIKVYNQDPSTALRQFNCGVNESHGPADATFEGIKGYDMHVIALCSSIGLADPQLKDFRMSDVFRGELGAESVRFSCSMPSDTCHSLESRDISWFSQQPHISILC